MRRRTRWVLYPAESRHETGAEVQAAEPVAEHVEPPASNRAVFMRCSFSSSGVIEAKAGGQDEPPAFVLDAYDGGRMNAFGYASPVVVDLAGLERLGDRIPIHRVFDPQHPIGHGRAFAKGDTLRMVGIVATEGAVAKVFAADFETGLPWQASIGVMPNRVEHVRFGAMSFANGKNHRGPISIIRSGKLIAVTVVPIGDDDATPARVAAMFTKA